jgi:hypothetical protein
MAYGPKIFSPNVEFSFPQFATIKVEITQFATIKVEIKRSPADQPGFRF